MCPSVYQSVCAILLIEIRENEGSKTVRVSSQAQMAVDSGVLATFLLLASVDLPF